MNEPQLRESRIGHLDEISALLSDKLRALDAAPTMEPTPQRSHPLTEPIPHTLPTDYARELVESAEADLTALAQEWTAFRERLTEWETTQKEL